MFFYKSEKKHVFIFYVQINVCNIYDEDLPLDGDSKLSQWCTGVYTGRCRDVLSVDILRRGCTQSNRIWPALTSRLLPPQSVEHYGLCRRRYRVNIVLFPSCL